MSLDKMISPEELAAWLQVAPATLERWRARDQGPTWYKLGKTRQAPIRYKTSEVEAFLKANTFTSTKGPH